MEAISGFEKAIVTLEFDKVRARLADCAATDGAREAALSLIPETVPAAVRRRLKETTEARRLLIAKGAPSFGNVKDVGDAIERAEKGASLSTRELLDAANVLHTARTLTDYYAADRREPDGEEPLREIFGRLTVDRTLETRITRAILGEDQIADEASPALSDIRRRIRVENNKIKDILQRYTSGAYAKCLQENIVTQRNGRYVVPVKAEYRSEIKGLVHDTSASGATLFIEPMAVVEANNALKELESQETHEIDRILAELSAECAAEGDRITADYRTVTELAFLFAKGEFSCRLDGTEPEITEDGGLLFRRARHPLLDKKTVVPVTVSLGKEYDTMVITGPNTGGKTVTLKTIGLLSMMAQAGLHIPCADGSAVTVFDAILADIGDEQSIEQSLSTFSSHMVNIVSILDRVTDRSLVLFDELCAGTDPTEGAALAIAILGRVRTAGALCAATTHYAEIKAYALETEGVVNAACEFDIETLSPTYRLIVGAPGKSNAFAISRKLGLGEDVIEAASARISADDKRFEQVIEELEHRRMEAERERDAAIRERKEFERRRAEEEEALRKRIELAERESERDREQAVRALESARVTSEYVMRELEELRKQKESRDFGQKLEESRCEIRRRLRETGDAVNPVTEAEDDGYEPPRPLKRGDTVRVVSLKQQGVIADNPDKNGNVNVTVGIMKIRCALKDLRLVEEAAQVTTADRKRIAASRYRAALNREFSSSLDLRGQYGDDAWVMTDKYLDEAILVHVKQVTLIHGKGTGALRSTLTGHLKHDPRVKSFRSGLYGEGDSGVTVVELK